MALGRWEPHDRGHELSIDDTDNSGYLYWARTEPDGAGAWRWEAIAEDEWNVPMGNSAGTTATQSEAQSAAERWMRPERHLKAVSNPEASSEHSSTERTQR